MHTCMDSHAGTGARRLLTWRDSAGRDAVDLAMAAGQQEALGWLRAALAKHGLPATAEHGLPATTEHGLRATTAEHGDCDFAEVDASGLHPNAFYEAFALRGLPVALRHAAASDGSGGKVVEANGSPPTTSSPVMPWRVAYGSGGKQMEADGSPPTTDRRRSPPQETPLYPVPRQEAPLPPVPPQTAPLLSEHELISDYGDDTWSPQLLLPGNATQLRPYLARAAADAIARPVAFNRPADPRRAHQVCMPYHAMPCYAHAHMPCHAHAHMPCHAMHMHTCHAMPCICHTMPHHAMPCHAMPCHAYAYAHAHGYAYAHARAHARSSSRGSARRAGRQSSATPCCYPTATPRAVRVWTSLLALTNRVCPSTTTEQCGTLFSGAASSGPCALPHR